MLRGQTSVVFCFSQSMLSNSGSFVLLVTSYLALYIHRRIYRGDRENGCPILGWEHQVVGPPTFSSRRVQNSKLYLYSALYHELFKCSSPKRSGWHLETQDHSFTCHSNIYPQVEWAIPAFTSQPQTFTALWSLLFSHLAEGRKLSWPGWLVTFHMSP